VSGPLEQRHLGPALGGPVRRLGAGDAATVATFPSRILTLIASMKITG
jgi:hypothetical protein